MVKLIIQKVSESKGINKNQLAIRSQISIGVVRRYWDDSTESFDRRVLDKICETLNCDICDILVREKNT